MHRFSPLLFILLAAGCSDADDIRAYFFPVRELTDGLVYEYANQGNFSDREFDYWYFLGVDLDTALYLSSTHYADGLTPDQLTRERITNEGVSMEQLTLYPPDRDDHLLARDATVLYDRTFPFVLGDGLATGFRISFTPAGNPDATNIVSLDRIYRGDTLVNVLGEEYAAIVFDLRGEVSQRDPVEGDISPTFTGYEIYAEGLGLVEYARDLGPAGVLAGKLVRRLPMADYAARMAPE